MDGVLKKSLRLILVVFLLWFLFTDPAGLASLSRQIGTGIWEGLVRLFEAVSRFLTTAFA
jgi:hypothetical protein